MASEISGTRIDSLLAQMFGLYGESILDLHTKQFKEEDIKGVSTQQNIVQQYYLAFLYVYIIYLEVLQDIDTDWDYYKEKYCIDSTRKKLACHEIDLDDILAIYDLPLKSNPSCVSGVNSMDVEHCLVVEPTTLAQPVIVVHDLADLLANPSMCTNYITPDCDA